MRLVIGSALLVLALALTPAHAQAAGQDFGGAFCRQHFTCAVGDPAFPTVAQMISIAGSCTGGDGTAAMPFSEAAGLDSSGCLVLDPSMVQANSLTHPHCCIKDIGNNQCALYCSMVSNN